MMGPSITITGNAMVGAELVAAADLNSVKMLAGKLSTTISSVLALAALLHIVSELTQ